VPARIGRTRAATEAVNPAHGAQFTGTVTIWFSFREVPMFAILPLLGGLVLGRFTPSRTAIAVQIAFYAAASAVLISTAPDHGGSHTDGVFLSLILAPLSALTVGIGSIWRRRSQRA
jgi:hypothetical protein